MESRDEMGEGRTLRAQRKRRRLSETRVGVMAGCSQSEVSRFERGQLARGAKADRLRALLEQWESETPQRYANSRESALDGNAVFGAIADELEAALRLFRRTDARLDHVKAEKLGTLLGTLNALAKAAGVQSKD